MKRVQNTYDKGKLKKPRKYGSLIKDELWQVGASTGGEVIAIIIVTMGTILEDSYKSLKKIGMADQCNALQITAMNSSVILLNKHFATGDFCKRANRRNKPTSS